MVIFSLLLEWLSSYPNLIGLEFLQMLEAQKSLLKVFLTSSMPKFGQTILK